MTLEDAEGELSSLTRTPWKALRDQQVDESIAALTEGPGDVSEPLTDSTITVEVCEKNLGREG